MLRLILSLTAGLGALTTATAASDGWMDDNELKAAFAGKSIQGNYASGKAFTEDYRADGSIAYRERGIAYRGHWSLQAGSFCTNYHGDTTGGCYRVMQVSDNCYEFYFVARTELEAAEKDLRRPDWTARAAVTDRDATCSDRPSV